MAAQARQASGPGARTPRHRGSGRRPAGPAARPRRSITSARGVGQQVRGVEADPAAADGGVGPPAHQDGRLDGLLEARQGELLVAENALAARLVADHEDVGLAAVQQAERRPRRRPDGTASPGPRSMSQWSGAASGLSISAAPASKSATTASIGMPPPAIMMPVWPVARKSTSRPRFSKARAMASAVYFLPSAQSVPTVSSRLPARLRPDGDRDVGGRAAHVDQPPAGAARRPPSARARPRAGRACR